MMKMSKEELLAYFEERHDYKDNIKTAEIVMELLNGCYKYYDDVTAVIHNLTLMDTNVKSYSAVEIEQLYFDKYGSRIIIRCTDKFTRLFTEITSRDIRTISERFNARKEYEVITINNNHD